MWEQGFRVGSAECWQRLVLSDAQSPLPCKAMALPQAYGVLEPHDQPQNSLRLQLCLKQFTLQHAHGRVIDSCCLYSLCRTSLQSINPRQANPWSRPQQVANYGRYIVQIFQHHVRVATPLCVSRSNTSTMQLHRPFSYSCNSHTIPSTKYAVVLPVSALFASARPQLLYYHCMRPYNL